MAHLDAIPEPHVFNTANNPEEPRLSLKNGAINRPEASICEVTPDVYDNLSDKEPYSTEERDDKEIEDTHANKCRRTTPTLLQRSEDNNFIEEEFIEGYMPDETSFGEEMDLDNEVTQSVGFQSHKGKGKGKAYVSPTFLCNQAYATTAALADSFASVGLEAAHKAPNSFIYGCNDSDLTAYLCTHSLEYSACTSCKGKDKAANSHNHAHSDSWLLDSGCTSHFTPNAGDFIDYIKIHEPRTLTTVNGGHSSIIAWGTVLLSTQDTQGRSTTVCIGPVGHVPGLADCLLSLGQFLHQGMTVESNAIQIRLIRDGKIYLRFDTDPTRPNYYILPALSAYAKSIQYELVYALDYETMHRRIGPTSRDVLHQMRKNTVGFPENINIPDENPVCSGCAKGKTPAREFPAREECADNAFDLIHSDFKEFSTLSYAKFKYAVVFIDDHMSYAWVTLLKKKSDALNAAKNFLAMVESKFKAKVRSWRSD
ncbi:unnamed protein product [Peniophora sp. CBMAI 1063]|nr:unnamed protein product [Peniophora sp. CBMAI 1063]